MSQLALAEFRDGPRNGVVAYLVACSGCGALYTMRPRTFRDLRKQRRLPMCEPCRRPPTVAVTEQLRRWWLEQAGVRLAANETATDYVLANGLPGSIDKLGRDLLVEGANLFGRDAVYGHVSSQAA